MIDNIKNNIVIVRGAGDIASGIIWYLHKAHFKVIALEISNPSSIRREVCFSEAIYDGKKSIEGVNCIYCKNDNEMYDTIQNNSVSIIVDENLDILKRIKPKALIDAILAKKNLGTKIDMADLVIGVGPGFCAGVDCHYAIETMRGHSLAKIIEHGEPIPNTGVPGLILSHGEDRVIHSGATGEIFLEHNISDKVKKGDVLAYIKDDAGNTTNVYATIDGVLRGIIKNGFYVKKGLKIADIDPRLSEIENCFTISDKARSIGGAVLLAVNMKYNYE